MKITAWILAAALCCGGSGLAAGAEIGMPAHRTHASKQAHVAKIPGFVCNDDGRCWRSSLLKAEDYGSGHLFLVNRVSRQAGTCVGYNFQYPVGWDECRGRWDHGRGRIAH